MLFLLCDSIYAEACGLGPGNFLARGEEVLLPLFALVVLSLCKEKRFARRLVMPLLVLRAGLRYEPTLLAALNE